MNPLTAWIAGPVLALALGCSYLLDGPSDMQAEADTAAAVADGEKWHAALAREQAAHPERWSAEQRERAGVAVKLIAGGAP